MDRPIIYVTTEYGSFDAEKALKERGLGDIEPGMLSYLDAFNQTVGVSVPDRSDALHADCNDLSSIDVAISRLSERVGRRNILLVFDSLTSPYIFNGKEILRFMTQTLSRFAARGNAVLACIDEGCGREEDFVSMMSLSNGVIKMETEKDKRLLEVVKHPEVSPKRIELSTLELKPTFRPEISSWDIDTMQSLLKHFGSGEETAIRSEVGDYVNLFWPNFAHWSCMLWDPKRFPTMIYEFNKEEASFGPREIRNNKELQKMFPWRTRLLIKFLVSLQSLGLFMPRDFSKVKDMKKLVSLKAPSYFNYVTYERSGILEYLEDVSETDEHYFRVYENSDCWGFENVGAAMASHIPPAIAGQCKGLEKEDRTWNAVETKCIGLGDPYCEFKVVPGEIDGLTESLQKDVSTIERIHERLMNRLMRFMLEGQPLVERPRLGSDVHLHVVMHAMGFPHMAGQRYRMAQRMGGASAGKKIGEHLLDAGLSEDEAVKRILNLMDHCKVGKVSADGTIRIKNNCERIDIRSVTMKFNEPSCYFTTGFLNGFFSAVKNQHVKETKCIAMGDPYCEWEFR
jgi:predicted hydrocarbon binding protein